MVVVAGNAVDELEDEAACRDAVEGVRDSYMMNAATKRNDAMTNCGLSDDQQIELDRAFNDFLNCLRGARDRARAKCGADPNPDTQEMKDCYDRFYDWVFVRYSQCW